MLTELFNRLSSASSRVKYAAIKELRAESERNPTSVYPHFDFFAGLLRSDNSILRWNAMLILGNLAAADDGRKIDAILERYVEPIRGPRLIDAANTIRGATAIALARPDLAGRIVDAIFGVERAEYATAECRNVAIGHALKALMKLRSVVADRRRIDRFAARQSENSRPSTRRLAQSFGARAAAAAAAGRIAPL